MPDAIVLVERVLLRVQEQLVRDGAFAAGTDTCLRRYSQTALGNQLVRGPRTATFPYQHESAQVRQLRPGKVVARGPLSDGSSAVQDRPMAGSTADKLSYEELTDRNSVLAAAVVPATAGEDVDCPVCDRGQWAGMGPS
jgi:hypothetical protein